MSSSNPDTPLYLAASYAQAGREVEARQVAAETLGAGLTYSLERHAAKQPFSDQADRDHFLNGLRKAGLPE